jgi:hypothetical protein
MKSSLTVRGRACGDIEMHSDGSSTGEKRSHLPRRRRRRLVTHSSCAMLVFCTRRTMSYCFISAEVSLCSPRTMAQGVYSRLWTQMAPVAVWVSSRPTAGGESTIPEARAAPGRSFRCSIRSWEQVLHHGKSKARIPCWLDRCPAPIRPINADHPYMYLREQTL